jgi:cardiolipin synthase
VVLGLVFVAFLALSHMARPKEIQYSPPHRFDVRDPTFLPSVHALSNPVPVEGNRLEVLENGVEIFPAMLSAIASAHQTINLESYIFWSGEIAGRFREALIERARMGVRVRILLDGVGSSRRLDNEDVARLKRGGCLVEYFHPLKPWMLDVINNRTHRRILIVDGRIGFTGGVGIGDEWLGDADRPDHWRETHVRIEGPVVAQLQAAFQENWSETRGEALAGAEHFPRLERVGQTVASVVVSSARETSSETRLLYAVAIASASERILLSNSYFLPDADFVELFLAAARRGVDVKIIVPGKFNDVPATKSAGRSAFGELLRGGVRIYEYQPTMYHSKTMVVDGVFSTIGSTNFDNRSFRLNDEINVTVFDEPFAKTLEAGFARDLARSRPYTYAQWRSRSLAERFMEWALRPFRSQL